MRVLLDHPNPFLLAHGGMQIQIEQTHAGLVKAGVDVEYLRWWDDRQRGDVIHYFGRPPLAYLKAAQQKGMKVVLAQILTGLGSRQVWAVKCEKTLIRCAQRMLPYMITARFAWEAFRKVDACAANTDWEAHLMRYVFGAPPERVHIIPNGVEEVFLSSSRAERGRWLVCTATITERKRVIETVKAAIHAQTPLWVIGKPYVESDRYYHQFLELARKHPDVIRYEGAIPDRAHLAEAYRQARGFVLLSVKETRSLASEEAAACECPLLLSDLPWARSVFGQHASYCPVTAATKTASACLRRFYEGAPQLPIPPRPLTWPEVGEKLKTLYASL